MQMRLLTVCLIVLVVSGVIAVFTNPPFSDNEFDWRGLLYCICAVIFFCRCALVFGMGNIDCFRLGRNGRMGMGILRKGGIIESAREFTGKGK